MKPVKTYQVQGDGVDIQVGEWPGDGPAVLCLHGLTANLRSFELIAGALCKTNRVLAMDLRGRGLSGKPPTGYSAEAHCRDIAAVLDGLGLARASIMGHSLGAYIGLAFAAAHPERVERLVLLDGGAELSAGQWVKVGAGIKPSVDRLGKVMPDMAAYLALVRGPYYDPWNEAIEDYFRYEVEEVPGGVRARLSPEAVAEERANLAGLKPSDLYPAVKCPVLIVQAKKGMRAEDDLVLPDDGLQRMLAAMPTARQVVLAGTHHFSLVFQPNWERDLALESFLA